MLAMLPFEVEPHVALGAFALGWLVMGVYLGAAGRALWERRRFTHWPKRPRQHRYRIRRLQE